MTGVFEPERGVTGGCIVVLSNYAASIYAACANMGHGACLPAPQNRNHNLPHGDGVASNPRSPRKDGMRMNRKGFTLIELLIVVVIIGILAAIAIPKFANTKEKAYRATMKSDLRNLITAEEAYFADSVKYTSNLGTQYNTTSGVVEIGRAHV